MRDPIDWPMLHYTSRDPELHEAGVRCHDAVEAAAVASIAWANAPSKGTRDRAFRAAVRLRDAQARLDEIGARLWASGGQAEVERVRAEWRAKRESES